MQCHCLALVCSPPPSWPDYFHFCTTAAPQSLAASSVSVSSSMTLLGKVVMRTNSRPLRTAGCAAATKCRRSATVCVGLNRDTRRVPSAKRICTRVVGALSSTGLTGTGVSAAAATAPAPAPAPPPPWTGGTTSPRRRPSPEKAFKGGGVKSCSGLSSNTRWVSREKPGGTSPRITASRNVRNSGSVLGSRGTTLFTPSSTEKISPRHRVRVTVGMSSATAPPSAAWRCKASSSSPRPGARPAPGPPLTAIPLLCPPAYASFVPGGAPCVVSSSRIEPNVAMRGPDDPPRAAGRAWLGAELGWGARAGAAVGCGAGGCSSAALTYVMMAFSTLPPAACR
eukprot:m.171058 g.171058  ORF g.171058 m.171058 type:complete len:339 (+) comp13326_c0_seq1:41-1057(+)